jgi:hypothetical protein
MSAVAVTNSTPSSSLDLGECTGPASASEVDKIESEEIRNATAVFRNPALPGRTYLNSILDLVESILRHETPLSGLLQLFEESKQYDRREEMCDLNYDPSYQEILLGQSRLRDLQEPVLFRRDGSAVDPSGLPEAAAFFELSYFTQCPVSYRTRLVGEALAAVAMRAGQSEIRSRCIDALSDSLRGRSETVSAREAGAGALAILASAPAVGDAARESVRKIIGAALESPIAESRRFNGFPQCRRNLIADAPAGRSPRSDSSRNRETEGKRRSAIAHCTQHPRGSRR